MKILHTADWHLGAYVGPQCDNPYKRMENTIKCLDVVVKTARYEKPDVILICGDIFHQSRVWSDRALTEVQVAANYINNLSYIAPTIVLYGTPNHDGQAQFKTLRAMTGEDVHFYTEPQILKIMTMSGEIQIAGIPGFDKGYFRAQYPGLSAEEENRIFTQQINTIVQGLSAQLNSAIPSVLMAHHTVVGSEMDNGQSVYLQNEVLLEASTIENSAFDLVCLGHIHKAQLVQTCNKPVYYAGSLDAFTFNDEEHVKGFLIHEISEHPLGHKFIKTPARKFTTFSWSSEYTAKYAAGELNNIYDDLVKNQVVRILYTCDSEIEKALDKKKLERELYAAGAYYVAEIRSEKIHEVVNKQRMHEKLTVEDCLQRYLDEKKIDANSLPEIITEAQEIIGKVQATTLVGGQTGLFLPIEIEVRNYRSYAEEKLSFQDIYFAMVNGPNGIGKSSLFMDSIIDCLYEQPREGELTGWIRAGERSGSISFTFQLGDNIYRVTRTRMRSGKATLALARKIDSDWEDISCKKLVDTQQKIIQLLGMDADTFQSCVLIMQDQYGRFMEAKPDERMSVLANLLGLGIYEDLENETKSVLTEINRELKNTKTEVLALEEEISQINLLKDDLNNTNEQLSEAQKVLIQLKKNRNDIAVKVATVDQAIRERNRLVQDADKKGADVKSKGSKLKDLVQKAEWAQTFLAKETEIKEKYKELQEAREKVLSMDGKVRLFQDKQRQVQSLEKELKSLTTEKQQLEKTITMIQERLKDYDVITEQIEKLKDAKDNLLYQENKKLINGEIDKNIAATENKLVQNENTARYLKTQTDILQSSNCIDIEKAQCGFLKAAKEAANKLKKLNTERLQILAEIDELKKAKDDTKYDPAAHAKAKEEAEKYHELKQQLATLNGDKKLMKVHNDRYQEIIKRISEISDEKSKLDDEIYMLKQEVSGYEGLKAKVADLESIEEQWNQIPVAKNYLENLLPQIQDITKELDELRDTVEEYRQRASQLSIEIQKNEKYQEELKALSRSISDYENLVSHYNKQLGSLEEKLKALYEKEMLQKQKQEKISELAKKASRLHILSGAFSQDGIPHQIIRDIIPELESSANEILGQMTSGRMRLEFRTEKVLKSNRKKEVATLDIVIIDVDHGELPYLARSGGQKVRAALAVSFSLAMVKASRVGLQLGMMFVDEPPFLDAEGVESYCMALEVIHNQYPEIRIIAISHDENMKARFPQQLTVLADEKGSHILKRG